MTVERLHLAPGAMAYDSMLAAEHVVRYAFAAGLCRGRRVLDVACGEGYGSAMLAAAGAAQVVGVDIAEEAVALARARFGREGVAFRAGDAADLPRLLADQAPFDLIVSFETIEHLTDPRPFLEGLRALLAPGGGILISAPNEGQDGRASTNPFHRHAYKPETFRAVTEAVLGPADGFWLGMPLQGFAILPEGSPLCGTDREGLDAMLDGAPAGAAHLLPAQRAHRVDAGLASFAVAAWGVPAVATVAAAPVAFEAWVSTWRAVEWLRAENARLLRELAAAQSAAPPAPQEWAERLADCQRAALLDAQRLETARAALADARAAAARAAAERDAIRLRHPDRAPSPADTSALRAALAAREAELATIRASRGWRVLRAYARLYEAPLLGPPLRTLRGAAGRVVRALRRR
ncbi:SAM-dependent methyltransferase [Roseomonas alkaliterrae]|uniref:SAM-dependent methyltransferase n=3 Tax=Neoroseomonas alkaliterrae TaxID=1452450 RepID=A0A840XL37_9PROT|nr:methyltransferase domain-containing protein [Neoroseomonas alkaliterrae]MBB5689325.1 SAM-dependent methyltransferase [Neoroseomonas alkaliterrae]